MSPLALPAMISANIGAMGREAVKMITTMTDYAGTHLGYETRLSWLVPETWIDVTTLRRSLAPRRLLPAHKGRVAAYRYKNPY